MRSQRMPKKSSTKKKLTRREQRDLDVEISFIEGIVRRDPHYVEALQILGDDFTRRGRYRDGLKIDQKLAALRPDDSLIQYNLACSYSLTDRVNDALAALERALSLGYRDFKWLAEDPDLHKVRQHPLYQKIRAKVRTMQIKVG
jgi:tetratricopeptide (TPR) repeat protein